MNKVVVILMRTPQHGQRDKEWDKGRKQIWWWLVRGLVPAVGVGCGHELYLYGVWMWPERTVASGFVIGWANHAVAAPGTCQSHLVRGPWCCMLSVPRCHWPASPFTFCSRSAEPSCLVGQDSPPSPNICPCFVLYLALKLIIQPYSLYPFYIGKRTI